MKEIILNEEHLKKIKHYISNINKILGKYAKDIKSALKKKDKEKKIILKKIYLDKNKEVKIAEEYEKFKTDDIIYYRIEFKDESGEKRIDLFYRNFDPESGNIHVIPGIISAYKKKEGNEFNFDNVKGKNHVPIHEKDWELEKVTEILKSLKGLSESKYGYYIKSIGGFLDNIEKANDIKNKDDIKNKLDSEIKNIDEFNPKKSSERSFRYRQFAHIHWLDNAKENQKILCYYNKFYDKDDNASLYTFYTMWQKYDDCYISSKAAYINKDEEGNLKFRYPSN